MTRGRSTRGDYVVGRRPPYEIQPRIEHPPLCGCEKCRRLHPEERLRSHVYRIRRRSRFPDDRLMSGVYAREVKELEEARLRGESPLPVEDDASLLFRSLARFYLEENEWRTASSRERHASIIKHHLEPYLGDVPVRSWKAIHATRYQRKRTVDEHAAPATVNREMTVVKAIFNLAVEHEIIAANPMRTRSVAKLQTPAKAPDFFEPAEWRAFLHAFDDASAWRKFVKGRTEREGIRIVGARVPQSMATKAERARFVETRPFLEALFYTASRVGELAELRWKDVDLKRGLITIHQQKTRRSKTLPIAARLGSILSERPKGTPEARVFYAGSGGKFSNQRIWRAFALAIELARIKGKDLSPHKIRDTVGSWLAIAGFNEQTHIAEVLGHHRKSVTARYAHLANSSLAPAMQTLERIAREGFAATETQADSA